MTNRDGTAVIGRLQPDRHDPSREATGTIAGAATEPAAVGALDREDLRGRVDRAIRTILAEGLRDLDGLSGDADTLFAHLAAFVLRPAKRLRPAFVYWGYRASGGAPTGPVGDAAVRAACSTEFLHACALVHDDIMDGSALRRGQPAVQHQFADLHRREEWRGDPSGFGVSAAVLLGDLAFTLADTALAGAGLTDRQVVAALRVLNQLRNEVIAGQYLDLAAPYHHMRTDADMWQALTYKSAKYTVERPLHLGHAIADSEPAMADTLTAYALPLGKAFQLRDDVLSVYGDPSVTGKPVGDDLRAGKETFLLRRAWARAGPAERRMLRRCQDATELSAQLVEQLRAVISHTGALGATEEAISELHGEADAALAGDCSVTEPARSALRDLADYAIVRVS